MEVAQIIKYEGDNSTFIWKHPIEDFNTGSQLIVHESQEAIFFKNGQALDLFGAGRYTLETENIPFLKKIMNRATGDQSPFHAEVYFINMTEQVGIKWGTDSKVMFVDPCNNDYSFPVGARGELSLKVNNSRKLLLKLVGTENGLTRSMLYDYFRAPIMMHIKSYLPKVLRERQVSIYDLDQYLKDFSVELKARLVEELDDYGVTLEKFWITDILKPEDDPVYIKLRNLRGRQSVLIPEAQVREQEALINQQIAMIDQRTEVEKIRMQEQMKLDIERQGIDNKAYEQKTLGYTFQQARQFDVMEKLAENEGSGSDLRNAAMGLGMGFGMGGPIGSAFGALASSTLNADVSNPFSTNISSPSENNNNMNTYSSDIPELLEIAEEPNVNLNSTGIVFCENCGNKMSMTARFCSMCGTKRGE